MSSSNAASSQPTDAKNGEGMRRYVFYPKEVGLNDELNQRGYEKLVAIADASRIKTSAVKGYGINFWRAQLTESELEEVMKLPEVSYHNPPVLNYLYTRHDGLTDIIKVASFAYDDILCEEQPFE
jgi:hypothetical protein